MADSSEARISENEADEEAWVNEENKGGTI
jgi:hypothetical protein